MRILVAEDNSDLRDAVVLALEKKGWEVFGAKDGRDALRVYHNAIENDGYFDVVLLDIEMPRLNGFAVGVNVRNLEKFGNVPRAAHIYFTGYDDVVAPEQLMDIEFADGYLRKPVNTAELIGKIEEVVSQRDSLPSTSSISQ